MPALLKRFRHVVSLVQVFWDKQTPYKKKGGRAASQTGDPESMGPLTMESSASYYKHRTPRPNSSTVCLPQRQPTQCAFHFPSVSSDPIEYVAVYIASKCIVSVLFYTPYSPASLCPSLCHLPLCLFILSLSLPLSFCLSLPPSLSLSLYASRHR